MLHGINNTFLYAAKKIEVEITDGYEVEKITGTGFFVTMDDNTFLITNRHMLKPFIFYEKIENFNIVKSFRIESFQYFNQNEEKPIFESAFVQNFDEFKFDPNPYNDIACLLNAKVSPLLTVNANIPFSLLADKEWINTKLSVCDYIAYPGYPEWFDKRNNTPIFRMGTIASDPRLEYSNYEDTPLASKIAYEGFSSWGASGSPVFAVQKGFPVAGDIEVPPDFYREVKVIGVNAGHFGSRDTGHSGISYFFKSSAIIDLILLCTRNG